MDPLNALLAMPQFARYAIYAPAVSLVANAAMLFLAVPTTASSRAYQAIYKIAYMAANWHYAPTILPPAIATHRAQQDAAIDAGLPLPPAPTLPPAITLPVPKPK